MGRPPAQGLENAIQENRELGLGVINPRTEEIEPVARVVARVEEALRHLPPERIFLNPDCGFGTFSSRPMNSAQIITRKLTRNDGAGCGRFA